MGTGAGGGCPSRVAAIPVTLSVFASCPDPRGRYSLVGLIFTGWLDIHGGFVGLDGSCFTSPVNYLSITWLTAPPHEYTRRSHIIRLAIVVCCVRLFVSVFVCLCPSDVYVFYFIFFFGKKNEIACCCSRLGAPPNEYVAVGSSQPAGLWWGFVLPANVYANPLQLVTVIATRPARKL